MKLKTNKKNNHLVVFAITILSFMFFQLQACGSGGTTATNDTPSDQGGGTNSNGVVQNSRSGTITIQFKNESLLSTSTSSALRSFDVSSSGESPTYFGMKLIAAYLAEDVDPVSQNNIGQTLMFYLNEDCENDIMHCDLSGGTAEDGNPMDKIIGANHYFDLTDPVAANAELSSQTQQVMAGSYQYARMEFCKYNTGAGEGVAWEYTGVPRRSFLSGQCGITSAKIVPAVTLPSSAAVTFIANYTTMGSITTGDTANGNDCTTDTNGTRVCFSLPTFTPEIIVQ